MHPQYLQDKTLLNFIYKEQQYYKKATVTCLFQAHI